MYLTLTLNPSIDYYIELPAGKKLITGTDDGPAVNRSVKESFEAGGKGINVALVLHRLADNTAQVTAAGFEAGFTGKEIIRIIEQEGLISKFIEVPGNTRINLKAKDGNGLETEINGSGPAVGPGDISRLIDTLKKTDFDTLFISGSLPRTLNSDAYSVIMTALQGFNPKARIILDCEGETLIKCLPLKPFLIKPNARELASLTGMKINTSSPLNDIREAAVKLIRQGAQNVLVSLGENGAYLLTGSGEYYHTPGIKGDVISTIGAGDTMIASFIYGIDNGMDMQKALGFSNACAAKAAFSEGIPGADALGEVLKEFS